MGFKPIAIFVYRHKATKILPLPFIKLNDIGRSTSQKKGI
jgi:hypothetical protein